MNSPNTFRHWSLKFRNAFRGIRVGVRGESSFYIHFLVSGLVFIASVVLKVSLLEWCVLLACMGTVLSAELFNSALERIAKAVTQERNDHIRDTLDIASGAVLVASIFAALVGATIFVFRLGLWLGWWGGYLLI